MTQGFEQILPSSIRTGHTPIPKPVLDIQPPTSPTVESPTIFAPQPMTSRLLRATPATEYPVRSVSPDFVPDRMADRVGIPDISRRLTPQPEKQRLASVGA